LSIDAYGLAGDRAGVAGAVHGLGDVLTDAGRLDEALPRLLEALELAAQLEAELTVAHVLGAIAAALARLGRPAEASRLWGAVQRFEENLGVGLWAGERARYVRTIGVLDVGEAELGRALSSRDAVAVALELSAAPAP
jgi:tetratricopeptide (TPR) repeat protein